MASDKTKEIREWATLILSAVTVIAIPLGLLILKNQRLEIMSAVETKLGSYVPLETYKKDVADQARSQGELKGKLDSVFIEQLHMSDSFSAFKDQMNTRPKP